MARLWHADSLGLTLLAVPSTKIILVPLWFKPDMDFLPPKLPEAVISEDLEDAVDASTRLARRLHGQFLARDCDVQLLHETGLEVPTPKWDKTVTQEIMQYSGENPNKFLECGTSLLRRAPRRNLDMLRTRANREKGEACEDDVKVKEKAEEEDRAIKITRFIN
ncbi:hypothetical protein B0H11DRAFT_1941414 [Mycena galericulata]|nr:hypothetical protein B0H11DRAFT_1941414 [Mycena galericulata]